MMIKRTSTIYGSQATLSHILGAYMYNRTIDQYLTFILPLHRSPEESTAFLLFLFPPQQPFAPRLGVPYII